MKTYQMTLANKTLDFVMSKASYDKARRSIQKTLQVNHYSLTDRGTHCMELWTPSPQWELAIDDKRLLLAFWEGLPTKLKAADLLWLLPKCQEYQDKFRDRMLATGKERNV